MMTKPTAPLTFGRRLRAARLTSLIGAGLTQAKVASKSGVGNRQYWCNMEAGRVCPDVDYRRQYERLIATHARITAIAAAVGLTFDDLVPPESLPEWPGTIDLSWKGTPAAELPSSEACTDPGCLGCNAPR